MSDEVEAPTEWRSALPPELRSKHVHSWCPFCYLGWRRTSQKCCSQALPTGQVDMHVPAIDFDREDPMRKVLGCLMPRPWEVVRMTAAGVDPRTMRREIPGLAVALERDGRIRKLMKAGSTREAAITTVDAVNRAWAEMEARTDHIHLNADA